MDTIEVGTCSTETEDFLKQDNCTLAILEQPSVIRNTLINLITFSCTHNPLVAPVDYDYDFNPDDFNPDDFNPDDFNPDNFGLKFTKKTYDNRLAPVEIIDEQRGYKTEVDFSHTRNRYPWICSLRTRGLGGEHLCAVNLLSVPPQPTVIVGAAHCNFLCRDTDSNGVRLPVCCCVSKGQESCEKDEARCGTSPRAVKISGEDTEILCGEWETSEATPESSKEEYNVVLPIIEVVIHPNFDASGEGPGAGNDIAIYKVEDKALVMSEAKIYPACLPTGNEREPKTKPAVHSGWSKPPPFSFLNKYASGFTSHYSDFFKQWHYKMDIQDRCRDATKSQAFGQNLTYPSNSYYPQGTICARDFTLESCFSTGDSGSPLMVIEESNDSKYHIEGILSFVKGCDQFSIGPQPTIDGRTEFQMFQLSENPAAYTKLSCFLPWVAKQYGLSYTSNPSSDASCNVGSGEKSTAINEKPCRSAMSDFHNHDEKECIFPFYYKNKFYNECVLFEEANFVYPVFRCPVYNITTKRDGINDFGLADLAEELLTGGYCVGKNGEMDPERECSPLFKAPPFATCKNDCPGGIVYNIISPIVRFILLMRLLLLLLLLGVFAYVSNDNCMVIRYG